MPSLAEKTQEAALQAYPLQAERAGDAQRARLYRKLPALYAGLAMQSSDEIAQHPIIQGQAYISAIRLLEKDLAACGLSHFSLLGRGGGALAFECREAPLVLRLSKTPPAFHPEGEGLMLPALPVSLSVKTGRSSKPPFSATVTPWVPTLDRLLARHQLDLEDCRHIMRQVRKAALERGFFPVDLDIDGLKPDDPTLPRVLGNVGLLPDGTPVVVDLDALEPMAEMLQPAPGAGEEEQRHKTEMVHEIQASHRDLPALFNWRMPGGEWKTALRAEELSASLAPASPTRSRS